MVEMCWVGKAKNGAILVFLLRWKRSLRRGLSGEGKGGWWAVPTLRLGFWR